MYGNNPWEDEPDWWEEDDAVDRAYDELKDRRLEEEYVMRVTHGHDAEEKEYV